MRDVSQLELLGRSALAAALGAIIGIERESRNHAAGIHTCALASLGACGVEDLGGGVHLVRNHLAGNNSGNTATG